MKVQTTQGLIDRDLLEIRDVISEEDNSRIIATEWYLDNELVRRDVNINVLRGIELFGEASI